MSAPADSATAQPPARMAHTPDPPPTAAAAGEALAAPRRGFLAAGWAKFRDNAIPSLVVAVIAGLVLFFFNETGDRITRLDADIGGRITKLEESIDTRFTKLEESIDTRFTRLEESIDTRFTRLEESIDTRFTEVDARFTKLEDEVDARFAKLEENEQQIAVTLATLIGEFTAFQQDVDNRFDAVDARFDAVDARFAAVETRLTRLEENQQEIALTLSRLVTLLEGRDEALARPSG